MSAPLVINLRDGSVWERRAMTAAGVALYALAGSCKCPEFLMASESELAAQGIAGTADVLPVPVGPEPEPLSNERMAEIRSLDLLSMMSDRVAPVISGHLAALLDEVDRLRAERDGFCDRVDTLTAVAQGNKQHVQVMFADLQAAQGRVSELEAERHSTNEALDDAVQALRVDRDRIVELERMIAEAPASYALMERARVEADGITRRLAPSQVLREDEAAVKCRCGEPGVDPYACEAEDCTHEFSELNPFGGGSGPVEGHDAKVSRACGCGFRTTVWHVADGSAEAELHEHVTRVHGGVYPAEVAQ